MLITDRDADVLDFLLQVGFATTPQIRREFFPMDKDGSTVRDRLRKLEAAGFAQRRRAEVANPLQTGTMPVWIINEPGIAAVSAKRDNPQLLNLKPPCVRSWQNFAHYAAVTDFFLILRKAIKLQSKVKLGPVYFEHTVVNSDATEPQKRYKLYTDVSQDPNRKIVCAPDAAFELAVGPYKQAFYLELERGFDSPSRVAAKKTQGFAALHSGMKWKNHFPDAGGFRVLALTPTPGWRDGLRRAIREKKVGEELWQFAALTDVTPETLLHGEVFYRTSTDGAHPLVRP